MELKMQENIKLLITQMTNEEAREFFWSLLRI